MLAPVTIEDCRLLHARSYVSAFRPVVLSFTNRRTTPATAIRIRVEYGGRTEEITDEGRFAENVRIDHAFSGFYNATFSAAPPECSVREVEFADGSVWTANDTKT
jgi:hypothetical protein